MQTTNSPDHMQTTHSPDQKLWKRCLQDALFELDPQALRMKLEVAGRAIEMRRFELDSAANPDSLELAELVDGLHTLRALGFLTETNADC
jgi:hypothetical protein